MAIKKQTKRKSSGSKRRAQKRIAKKRPSKRSLKKKVSSRKKQKRPQKRRASSKKKRTSVTKRKRIKQRLSRKGRRKLKGRHAQKLRRKARRMRKKRKVAQDIEDFSKKPHECLSIDDKEAEKPNKKPVVFVTTPKGVAVSCPVDPADGQGRIFIGNKEGGDFLLVESHFDNKPKTADKTETVKVDDCSESYEMVDFPTTGENSSGRISDKPEEKEKALKSEHIKLRESMTKALAPMKRSPTVADCEGQKKFPPADRFGPVPSWLGSVNRDPFGHLDTAAEKRSGKDEPSLS